HSCARASTDGTSEADRIVAIHSRWVGHTEGIIQRIGIAIEGLGVGGVVTAVVGVGGHPAARNTVVLTILRMVRIGFKICVHASKLIIVQSTPQIGMISEYQLAYPISHTSTGARLNPFRSQPILMLKKCLVAFIKGYRQPAPVDLSLNLIATAVIPDRDATTRQIKNISPRGAACRLPYPAVEGVINIGCGCSTIYL